MERLRILRNKGYKSHDFDSVFDFCINKNEVSDYSKTVVNPCKRQRAVSNLFEGENQK